jgi:hypothetical protein
LLAIARTVEMVFPGGRARATGDTSSRFERRHNEGCGRDYGAVIRSLVGTND